MRIQILPLPSVVVGEMVEEPFALIVDEFNGILSEAEAAQWSKFAQECGARTVALSEKTVDVADRYLPEPVHAEPLMRVADPVVPPREFDPYVRLKAFETAQRVLEGVAKLRALCEIEKVDGLVAAPHVDYQRGFYNGLKMALSIIEDGASTGRSDAAPVPAEG